MQSKNKCERFISCDLNILKNLIRSQWFIFFIFFTFSLSIRYFHEPWRDEAQAWIIGRDNDIFSILKLTAYNGTPSLWYAILSLISWIGLPYYFMGIVHSGLSAIVIMLILTRSPFPTYLKILIPFSYYFIYEYSVISRSYVLSLLIIFLIATLYKEKIQNAVVYSILLFFLMQTNVHSMIISIPLAFSFFLEMVKDIRVKNILLPLLIVVTGFFFAFYQVYPPDDLMLRTSSWNSFDIRMMVLKFRIVINNAFFPISILNYNFWNFNLINEARYFSVMISFITFPYTVYLLATIDRSKRITLIYTVSTIGLVLLFLIKYTGAMRHHGLIFILFIFSIWIIKNQYPEYHKRKFHTLTIFLSVILSVQILTGGWAIFSDIKRPFSHSKNVAIYLIKSRFIGNDVFLASSNSWILVPILPYLPRQTKFYHLETGEFRTFITETLEFEKNKKLPTEEVYNRFSQMYSQNEYRVGLLVSNSNTDFGPQFRLIADFTNSIVPSESYYIYLFSP